MSNSVRSSSLILYLPSQMAEHQKRDTQLPVSSMNMLLKIINLSCPRIHCVRSKPIRHLLLQYDYLSLIWGVLHHHTFKDDMMKFNNSFFLILSLHDNVLQSLHDDSGHQGCQHVLDLLRYKVYWPTMFA